VTTTIVLAAPAGIDGAGRLRASAPRCAAPSPRPAGSWGSGLPSASLLGADRRMTGGALPAVAVAVPGVEQAVAHRRIAALAGTGLVQPFATTNPYSTLGDHPPGRPRS
jgi:hypothetical protein